ncbi:MAG: hypothetical protein K1X72_12755 [Pyrinomonadaceae bacterium]|nr:hypothetical protein [Pyrinomonadaceae bacterium]
MKKLALLIGLVFTFGVLANAQSTKQIAVHVPFDFYVKGQKMNAGDYVIESASPQSNQAALIFREKSGKAKGMLITIPIDLGNNQMAAAPFMLFNRYGDEYFLKEIFNPLENIGFGVSSTKTEKYIAKKFGKPTQETVAMNLR